MRPTVVLILVVTSTVLRRWTVYRVALLHSFAGPEITLAFYPHLIASQPDLPQQVSAKCRTSESK